MMMFSSNLPTLDLHGMDREITKILVKEFIKDNYKMGNYRIVIIHGKGTGILKQAVHDVLVHEKIVKEYKIDFFNDGCTLVELKTNI